MQSNRFIQVLFIALLNLSVVSAGAQTYAGAGLGTFNVPGAIGKFRGWGPTLKLERLTDNEVVAFYVDLSLFSKTRSNGYVSVYDNSGNRIGSTDAETKYSYLYSQTGMKVVFGRASKKKLLPYAAGGVALVRATTTTSYKSDVGAIDDDKANRFIFGFHLGAGLQYNLQPVILELRGNLDIDLKPLVPDSDVANILSNTRLSVLIPLSK